MGRAYSHGNKKELEGLIALDMVWLKKIGCLDGSIKEGRLIWNTKEGKKPCMGIRIDLAYPCVRFSYALPESHVGTKGLHAYDINLTPTSCNYGGQRWWFFCPLIKSGAPCMNRIRKLYMHGGYFGCRRCLNLIYANQNENPTYRKGAFRVISDECKAAVIWKSIKVPYYAGKPTKKMRHYIRLHQSPAALSKAWAVLEAGL